MTREPKPSGKSKVKATTRDEVLALAVKVGWKIIEPKGGGYTKVKCPCGKHPFWLHFTPSNPNYFAEKAALLQKPCPPPPAA